MFLAPPSTPLLTNAFQRILAAIDEGALSCVPDCVGLDEATTAALNALAVDRRHRARKIMAARNAFAAQLARMAVN